jgi:hypothetical protein
MAKKSQGASVNLDSFLDIMTCLVGVLVLIIILTGLDASQIRVLIPTPMEYDSDKRPIFIEARNNELYRIPLAELQRVADETLRDVSREAGGNLEQLLRLMHEVRSGTDAYQIDLSFFTVGQFAIRPVEGVPGYPLTHWDQERVRDWFGSILAGMNAEEEMLTFLVRDDSFDVFKRARHLAWHEDVDVSYELLDVHEVIKFGLLGTRSRPQ